VRIDGARVVGACQRYSHPAMVVPEADFDEDG